MARFGFQRRFVAGISIAALTFVGEVRKCKARGSLLDPCVCGDLDCVGCLGIMQLIFCK